MVDLKWTNRYKSFSTEFYKISPQRGKLFLFESVLQLYPFSLCFMPVIMPGCNKCSLFLQWMNAYMNEWWCTIILSLSIMQKHLILGRMRKWFMPRRIVETYRLAGLRLFRGEGGLQAPSRCNSDSMGFTNMQVLLALIFTCRNSPYSCTLAITTPPSSWKHTCV